MTTRKRGFGQTPQEARTLKEICDLPCSTISTGRSWILVDVGSITIMNQRTGEAPTGSVKLTRAEFDRMVHWYTTGETRRPRAKP